MHELNTLVQVAWEKWATVTNFGLKARKSIGDLRSGKLIIRKQDGNYG